MDLYGGKGVETAANKLYPFFAQHVHL